MDPISAIDADRALRPVIQASAVLNAAQNLVSIEVRLGERAPVSYQQAAASNYCDAPHKTACQLFSGTSKAVKAVCTLVISPDPLPLEEVACLVTGAAGAVAGVACALRFLMCLDGGDSLAIEELTLSCSSTTQCNSHMEGTAVGLGAVTKGLVTWEIMSHIALYTVEHYEAVTPTFTPHPTLPNVWYVVDNYFLWHGDLRCSASVSISVVAPGAYRATSVIKTAESSYCTAYGGDFPS